MLLPKCRQGQNTYRAYKNPNFEYFSHPPSLAYSQSTYETHHLLGASQLVCTIGGRTDDISYPAMHCALHSYWYGQRQRGMA